MAGWYKEYVIRVKDNPELCELIDGIIARIRNDGFSKEQALYLFAEAAAEKYANDPEYTSPILVDHLNHYRYVAEGKRIIEKKKNTLALNRGLDPVEHQKLADKYGIDRSKEMEEIIPLLSFREKAKWWITKRLTSDLGEHQFPDVLAAAIRDGLITDPEEDPVAFERDKSAFQEAGSVLKCSGGRRGVWQWTEESGDRTFN